MTRAELHAALSASAHQDVRDVGEALAAHLTVRHLAVPQDGLWMLTLRDGVAHEPFYLGELPVAQARVAVHDAAGNQAEGGARLIGASAAVAVAAAVCDAVWAGHLAGRDHVVALAARGHAAATQRDRRRAGLREATRVRFTELGETT